MYEESSQARNATATGRPMPLSPPVINATLPGEFIRSCGFSESFTQGFSQSFTHPRSLCRVFLTQFNHVWQASLLVLCFLGCYSRPAAGINHRRPVVTVDKPSPFYRSAYPSNCGKKQRSVLLFSIVAAVSTGARPTGRDVSFWFLHSRPTSVSI